jgi:hypothetical protein
MPAIAAGNAGKYGKKNFEGGAKMASLNLKVRRELLFNIRPLNVQLGSCC